MKILIVDDHKLFAEGLKNLLQTRNYNVVAIAKDGSEAVEFAKKIQPDIVFMDIKMPNCDGLEATMLINLYNPDIKIIMLTTSEDDEDLFTAIKYGACGYFVKSIESQKLFELLDEIKRGNTWVFAGIAGRLIDEIKNTPSDTNNTLTERQLKILSLVSKGKTYKEIAEILNITERTIKYHIKNAIDKVHLQNRQQLISYATKLGLIK